MRTIALGNYDVLTASLAEQAGAQVVYMSGSSVSTSGPPCTDVGTTTMIEMVDRAGVAGIHIEDQTFPEECSLFRDKSMIETDEMVQKVRAAVEARENVDIQIHRPHGH